jgi:hypothetical protein
VDHRDGTLIHVLLSSLDGQNWVERKFEDFSDFAADDQQTVAVAGPRIYKGANQFAHPLVLRASGFSSNGEFRLTTLPMNQSFEYSEDLLHWAPIVPVQASDEFSFPMAPADGKLFFRSRVDGH